MEQMSPLYTLGTDCILLRITVSFQNKKLQTINKNKNKKIF